MILDAKPQVWFYECRMKVQMKNRLPWLLCLVLTLALVFTHFPRMSVPIAKLPADFAEFGSGRWLRINSGKHSVLWKSADEDVWALTCDERLVALFADGESGVHIIRNGKVIACLPTASKSYDNMRQFYITGSDGHEYSLVDYNGDGEIDVKDGNGRFWIYKHGEFLETVFTNRYLGVKHLLDGRPVVFENGRWKGIDQDVTNDVTRTNGLSLGVHP